MIFGPDCKGLSRFSLRSPTCPGSDKTASKSCFNNKALSVSVFVYVDAWLAFNNKLLRTSVFVHVVTLSALNNRLLSVYVFVYVVNLSDCHQLVF